MADPISNSLRKLVARRANYKCEYCLIAESDTFLGCQVDHIISVKHGGLTTESNLAYACTFCNRYKGSDIASITQDTGEPCRFYNPRLDKWNEHFVLHDLIIEPKTDIGEVTSRILKFNIRERVLEREILVKTGKYPPR
jgi:hypothetical protein